MYHLPAITLFSNRGRISGIVLWKIERSFDRDWEPRGTDEIDLAMRAQTLHRTSTGGSCLPKSPPLWINSRQGLNGVAQVAPGRGGFRANTTRSALAQHRNGNGRVDAATGERVTRSCRGASAIHLISVLRTETRIRFTSLRYRAGWELRTPTVHFDNRTTKVRGGQHHNTCSGSH